MQNAFLDQPISSSAEIAAFLRKSGLDFDLWPQSVLPEEMLKALDAGTDEDIEMLTAHSATTSPSSDKHRAKLGQYRAELIAENHAPRAIIRTSWGLLVGEQVAADMAPDLPFARYSVEVQCDKGWNNPNLGAYCDACMEMLDDSLQAFLKQNRSVAIEMGDADVDGILELSVFVTPTEDEHAEQVAVDGLARYLIQILEDGTLDRIITAGGRATRGSVQS
jgi:hypothetical protein